MAAKRDKSWIFLSATQEDNKANSDLQSTSTIGQQSMSTSSQFINSTNQLDSRQDVTGSPSPHKAASPSVKKMVPVSNKLMDSAKNGLKLKNFTVMQRMNAAKGASSQNNLNNICMTSFHHPHEQRQLTDAAHRLKNSKSISEAYEILEDWSLEGLLTSVPYSLPLIETLYANFMAFDRSNFPVGLLRPDLLMQHILWWAAFEDTANAGKASFKLRDDLSQSIGESSVALGCSTLSKRPEAHCWTTVLPNITSLVRITVAVAPPVHATLLEERKRIEKTLESLGLHGLVNCGETQLIDISDAVRSELASHQQKLKSLIMQYDRNVDKESSSKLNKLLHHQHENGTKNTNAGALYSVEGGCIPSSANHQRLMALKMSEIRNRVHRNETTLHSLRLALRNSDLESLERILQKRIGYDKDVLNQVNGLRQNSTSGYSLSSEDPTVSGVLMQFKKAYDKLLHVFPSPASDRPPSSSINPSYASPRRVRTLSSPDFRTFGDSGIGEDDSCDSIHGGSDHEILKDSPPPNSGDSRASLSPPDSDNCGHVKTGRLLGPVAQLIQAKSKRFHRSLQDINQLSLLQPDPLYSNPQDLAIPLSQSKSASQILLQQDSSMYPYQANFFGRDPHLDRMELGRLQAEVSRLSRDLSHSNKLVQRLSRQRAVSNERDYGSHSSSASSSSAGRIASNRLPYNLEEDSDSADPSCPAPVQKYRTLFTKDRVDTIKQLNQLPQLAESPELQMKIIFTVIVLSFRSVSEALLNAKKEVWSKFKIAPTEDTKDYAKDFHSAVYRFMLSRAKTNNGMDNAKEVTSQIWLTLYDFPSLKTCIRFNRFILDCIQVAWDLLAGVDGNPPRFRLDYDASNTFNSEKHLRFQGSSLRSSQILRFIWPGLIECDTENCVYKGVVMT